MFPTAWLGVVAAVTVTATEEINEPDEKAERAEEEPSSSNKIKWDAATPAPKRQMVQQCQAIKFLEWHMLPYDVLVEICKQLVQRCEFGPRVVWAVCPRSSRPP